jgi:hypothetical protein
MKIRSLIAAVFILVATTAFAQDWSGNKYKFGAKYPGYIITSSGDTVRGFIQHNGRSDNQVKCVFWTNPDDKKTKKEYEPEDIKGYMVGDKTYRSIQYSGGLMAKPWRFNLLITDGHIAAYKFYNKKGDHIPGIQSRGMNETEAQYDERMHDEDQVFQKGTDKPVTLQYFGIKFSSKMAEYVSDYPELAKKVEDKEKGYGMLKILDIIDEYNKWYAENHKK